MSYWQANYSGFVHFEADLVGVFNYQLYSIMVTMGLSVTILLFDSFLSFRITVNINLFLARSNFYVFIGFLNVCIIVFNKFINIDNSQQFMEGLSLIIFTQLNVYRILHGTCLKNCQPLLTWDFRVN